MNLQDVIREELADHVSRTGQTYYAVARACRIEPAGIYRFRDSKRGLQAKAFDRLAGYLRLALRKV